MEETGVKRKASTLMMVTVTVMLVIAFYTSNIKLAVAQGDYEIKRVNHRIEILYNGYILISDAIEISGSAPDSFLIGFPYRYGLHLVKCVAYNSTAIFQVQLDVPLEDKIGFYGVEIRGASLDFTVAFILSNDLLKVSDSSNYTLDFPAYPTLTKEVENCAVAIILPEDAGNVVVTKDDEVVNGAAYFKAPLPAFAYSPANLTFTLTDGGIQLFDINALERRVEISGTGEIGVSDSYYITSKSPKNMEHIEVVIPYNASNLRAEDQFGRKMPNVESIDVEKNSYTVAFSLPLESHGSTRFAIKYSLPSQVYINAYNINVTPLLFKNLNCYVKQASLNIALPEGARIQSLAGVSYGITRNAFQETAILSVEGVTYLESVVPSKTVSLMYEYNPLWLSFRPTLWMWALTLVGLAVAVVWKRPKAAEVAAALPTVAVRLSPEHIKSFVDAYEEKQKIISDLELLEVRVRKGKIPRRRYNVQKETLKTRLNSLSRKLTDIKERMRAAGGHYADLVRQLEVAETEITEVENSIKSIEARHSRGELSLEAYRRLLADYQRRKDKAETAIKGILLRLREEIH
ncbi:MAG: hypothetical protein QXI91_04990 [Candidatus Bathyarchaeia archaeon]